LRETNVNLMKSKILSSFYNSPSYCSVMSYAPTLPLVSTARDTWITDATDLRDQKNITMLPDQELTKGYLHLWRNEYWLTIQCDEDFGDVYSRGVISRCYSSLKWLDSDGIVRETPFCPKTDTASNFGVEDGKVLTLPNERRHILLQDNIYSTQIVKGSRFIIDKRSWRVSVVDRLYDGIIILVIDEDGALNSAIDNIDLRVANYYGNVANYTLEIVNGSSLSMIAEQTVQLNTLVKNNGVVVNPAIIYASSNDEIATIDANGLIRSISNGTVVMTARLVLDNSITDTISVTVEATVADNFTIEIMSTSISPDEIKKNQTKNYFYKAYNNGIEVTSPVTFTLFADDKLTSTNMATIVSQDGTNCTIKNVDSITGYVQLKCVLNSDSLVYSWKRIQMKPLF
jgi:hypothetical protein